MSCDSKTKDFVLRKRAPKGVDSDKHERCVKEVKRQGHDVGSAHAICTASMKKAKEFAKEFKKSYDYRDHGVSIDSKDQQAAEETVNPKLITYLKTAVMKSEVHESKKIPLGEGVITLTKKDQGLYNGFWQDKDGQIMEKFDDQTIEMVAKNMMVKGWIDEYVEEVAPVTPERPVTMRIKMGDFELELRKSLKDFAKAWNKPGHEDIKKAVSVWKRHRASHVNNKQAVHELLENWDQFGEDFSQVLFAVQKLKGE